MCVFINIIYCSTRLEDHIYSTVRFYSVECFASDSSGTNV